MDIVLVPGFWLDASSWEEVTPPLVEAGHRVHALTLPGLESVDASRAGIGIQEHVDAVVEVVDGIDLPVVLVGHSGGGPIIHGVVDARPGRVARSIYVDSVPNSDGDNINPGLPSVGDDVPLPPWDMFDVEDLVDLTDELKASFIARAVPEPRGVTSNKLPLKNEARWDVPATVIACEVSSAQIREWIEGGIDYTAELARIKDVEFVDLPTGHWPQFTKPAELAAVILAAVDRTPS